MVTTKTAITGIDVRGSTWKKEINQKVVKTKNVEKLGLKIKEDKDLSQHQEIPIEG